MRAWIKENPQNVRGLMTFAALLIENERWDEAKQTLQAGHRPVSRVRRQRQPVLAAGGNSCQAGRHRQPKRTSWRRLAERDADAGATYLRLIEIAEAEEDWESLHRNAERLMAVNPLTPHPHIVRLPEWPNSTDQPETAMRAYRSLLVMDPDDPAELHYRLASNYRELDSTPDAKRHVLMALENAPRFRDSTEVVAGTGRGRRLRRRFPQRASSSETPAVAGVGPESERTEPSQRFLVFSIDSLEDRIFMIRNGLIVPAAAGDLWKFIRPTRDFAGDAEVVGEGDAG